MPPATHRPDFARAAVGGIVAGLAAGAVMNAFQAAWIAVTGTKSDGEPATIKAADKLAVAVTGAEVPETYRKAADPVVHYATAAALGLGYAVVAEGWRPIAAGGGTLFGAATAIVLDDVAVPALGLGPGPAETPLPTHVYGLASHLVFGAVLDGVRRLLRG